METSEKKYYPLIDFARFFAAFSVLSFHYFSITAISLKQGPLKIFLDYGFMGVQLFFIISGFVIFFSVKGGLKRYTLGRFLRIYPIFWFCCTLTYITTLIMSNDALPFFDYIKNLLIINDGTTAGMVDGSYWTLTHELIFYFGIGVFVFLFGKKNIEYFFYLWLIVLSIGVLFNLFNLFIFKLILVRSGFYFIFGGLLAMLVSGYKNNTTTKNMATMLALMITALMPIILSIKLIGQNPNIESMSNRFGVYDTSIGLWILSIVYVVAVISVFASYKIKSTRTIKLATILGGMTYPLYLLHHKIGSLVIDRFSAFGTFGTVSVAFIALLLAFTYFLYLYEKNIRQRVYSRLIKI